MIQLAYVRSASAERCVQQPTANHGCPNEHPPQTSFRERGENIVRSAHALSLVQGMYVPKKRPMAAKMAVPMITTTIAASCAT